MVRFNKALELFEHYREGLGQRLRQLTDQIIDAEYKEVDDALMGSGNFLTLAGYLLGQGAPARGDLLDRRLWDRPSGGKIMAVTSPGASALYIMLGFAGAGFVRRSQPSRQTDTSNPEFRCFRGGVPYYRLDLGR